MTPPISSPSTCTAASAQLRVVTLPNILFQNRNANHKIVSGSVIQLYCSATSMTGTPSITWVNNGVNLVNNPPHIRIRSSSNNTMNTTSSLTIDYFTSEDDGNYVCHATDGSTALDKSTTLIINGQLAWCLCGMYEAIEDESAAVFFDFHDVYSVLVLVWICFTRNSIQSIYIAINQLKYHLHSCTRKKIACRCGLEANLELGFASCSIGLCTGCSQKEK